MRVVKSLFFVSIFCFLMSFLWADNLPTIPVSKLKTLYKKGKTFIVFDKTLSYKGEYQIFRSNKVIKSVEGLKPITTIKNKSYMNLLCKIPYVLPLFGEMIEQQGLFVYTPHKKEEAFYAVLALKDKKPVKIVMGENSMTEAVSEEVTKLNYPFLQKSFLKYGFVQENYVTWLDAAKWANPERDLGSYFTVTYEKKQPTEGLRPVFMYLHALSSGWGGKPMSRYKKGFVTINFKDHYRDWWRGRAADRIMAGFKGYFEMTKLNVDKNRVYLQGLSMGGDGGAYHSIVNGDLFAATYLCVPRLIPDIHTKEVSAAKDMPPVFMLWALKDGKYFKVDGHVPFAKKMSACYQGYYEHWEDVSHAMTPELRKKYNEKDLPLGGLFRFKKNEAFPVFQNCTSDDNYGQKDSGALKRKGEANLNIDWNSALHPLGLSSEKLIDAKKEFVMTFKAKVDCTSDVIFRRVQMFEVKLGAKATYENKDSAGAVLQSGKITVVGDGLIQIKGASFLVKGNCITIRQ